VAALALAACITPMWAQSGGTQETVVVTGIRASEAKAVDLKRSATSIQDSIVAEDIGKFPDATISDSLQRITGVQIDRSAGEGSTVEIRGLPQVGTLLNGEVFVTADTIDSVQPNFTDIPATLFSGADVVKSSTANMLNAGITGTINLKTRRPFDLNEGFTFSGNVDGTHGVKSNKYEPEVSALVGYNKGQWGLLVTGTFSDVTNSNSQDGMDQYGGQVAGEDTGSSTSWDGILSSWGTNNVALPSGINLLTPAACPRSASGAFPGYASGCDVDIDGDGKATHAYYVTENFTALQQLMEREKVGFNASLQGDLGQGFSIVADFFYTDMDQHNRQVGYQLNSASWLGATFVPLVARDTGIKVPTNGNTDEFFTTQKYRKYLGDMETYSENDHQKDTARNYNFEMKYDNGGNFRGEVRALYGSAHETLEESYLQFTLANGQQWNKQASLLPGQYLFPSSFPTGISSVGGLRMFNTGGVMSNADYVDVDTTGPHLAITPDATYAAAIKNESDYALKTVSAEGDHERSTSSVALRADGHYTFPESGVRFDFGIRQGNRAADNVNYNYNAPVYGGDGAYTNSGTKDALGNTIYTASSTGCYVRWKAADVTVNDTATCFAGVPVKDALGNVTGASTYYAANYYAGLTPTQLPSIISKNMRTYSDLAGIGGITMYNLDPKAMDNTRAFQEALFPGERRNVDPGGTWHVDLNQTSGYVQGSLDGNIYVPFSLSAGLRVIKTNLTVTQHAVGNSLPYGQLAADNGTSVVQRSYTDVLPAINASVDVTDEFKVRAGYAKNMQNLNLSQWGGGLTLNYGIDTVTGLFPVLGGSSSGSPGLNPWRSSNYDLSFEYYYGKQNLISFSLFYIDVASFIDNGSVTRCDLPDQDGVIRNRCVAVTAPTQGAGKPLKGMELGIKQAFDFLPGLLGNTGAEFNATYSPSNVGTDLAGGKIGFPDNSELSGNAVLWYQDDQFEGRVAANYRTKRSVNQNWGGIAGMEMYQSPTVYLDAALSYQFTPSWQFYVQGSNLTGQGEHYYLTWRDQIGHNITFDPRYTVGVRAKF
jgi:TonB-dependent receptor